MNSYPDTPWAIDAFFRNSFTSKLRSDTSNT
jgi:hypothetical protein